MEIYGYLIYMQKNVYKQACNTSAKEIYGVLSEKLY